jgi:hypothetical protein
MFDGNVERGARDYLATSVNIRAVGKERLNHLKVLAVDRDHRRRLFILIQCFDRCSAPQGLLKGILCAGEDGVNQVSVEFGDFLFDFRGHGVTVISEIWPGHPEFAA